MVCQAKLCIFVLVAGNKGKGNTRFGHGCISVPVNDATQDPTGEKAYVNARDD